MLAARKLARRSEREARRAALVDSPLALEEAIASGARVLDLFVSDEFDGRSHFLALAAEHHVVPVSVPGRVLGALADTSTPQGVVAVVETPAVSLEEALEGSSLVLVMLGVSDPGNAGTLVRSAVAAGADAVVFARGAVDPFHPKTLRASGGSLWRIPIATAVDVSRCIQVLEESDLAMIGADARAATALWEADLRRPLALVLGSESRGLSAEIASHVSETYSIPMPGPAESLNIAVAGSIFLFECARQRRGR